jgi:nicotinate phosphoribosyltransferase
MVIAALNEGDLKASQGKAVTDWMDIYDEQYRIILSDTYGTESFFEIFNRNMAEQCKGVRHDSGDPIKFGERLIKMYQSYGIDPKKKGIVFSDGLTVEVMIELNRRFSDRINVLFGWGTNLTNDCTVLPLSIVIKVFTADGIPTVKLSDNPKKSIGTLDKVTYYKRAFGYKDEMYQSEEPTY